MSRFRSTFTSGILLLTLAVAARAEDMPNYQAVQNASQTIYKGLIGNVLDTLPMDPMKRVDLQRTTAVVSNTLSGRSLSVLAGLSNPLLMIGGLAWGLWAASNIDPAAADPNVAASPAHPDARLETEDRLIALADNSPAEKELTARSVAQANSVALNSIGDSATPKAARAPVIRIWLPQRSSDSARLGAL